ncbi:hypothetical protein [Streptomyces sp. CBMA29]|uniref:hypothetical protein n=1 Tax=Streptomyces sp. CBMA29 TaxID=1896314 RepID=UPI0016618D24|nr:hypothetical protein [Streptomyces sp. CBMA29]MBD0733993.1 hypothetical protein [Streptomyces sp. CBMA29]
MYDVEEWQNAFETAQLYYWDEIDAKEQGSELAGFLASIYTHEKVETDDEVVQAAIDAAGRQFPKTGWSAEQFQEVVESYIDSRPYGPGPDQPDYIEIWDTDLDMTYRFHRIRP